MTNSPQDRTKMTTTSRSLKSGLTLALLITFLCLINPNAYAVTIGGTINSYTAVTAIDYVNNNVTVASTTGFAAGDRVVIIQMTGATIDETNTAAFGDITNYNDAGNYEFCTICSIDEPSLTIDFEYVFDRTYDPSAGAVQLVKVPVYSDATISGTAVTCPSWDGTTGGVVAIEVTGTLTFNKHIGVRNKGFMYAPFTNSTYSCSWFTTKSDYFYDYTTGYGAQKGYGIADYVSSSKNGGRGAQANGGGGGNDHNAGGAGGSNATAGGDGGARVKVSTFYCGSPNPGSEGGKALTYDNTTNKIFMGGGGGAGHGNNSSGRAGTQGGGIVIVRAGTINGATQQIVAYADNASNASNDGGGGGGAGGTILMEFGTFNNTFTINNYGGNGSSVSNSGSSNCNGPGGGGAGGVLWVSSSSLPAGITVNNSGGAAGTILSTGQSNCTVGSTNGGTAGSAGTTLFDLVIPESTTPFAGCAILPVELVEFSAKPVMEIVQLYWLTATEINSDRFEIQRSPDGIHFQTIGKVQAAGNVTSYTQYTFDDHHPIEGTTYYRLKEFSTEGAVSYSWTTIVDFVKVDRITNVYPNPVLANNPLQVDLLVKHSGDVKFVLTDITGQAVHTETAYYKKGDARHQLNIGLLPAGYYFLKAYFEDSNQLSTKKIIIAW